MFENWHDFYLVLGPAAAGLIGLLFVVVSLTGNLERSRALKATRVYMTPIVFHLGVLVLLSTPRWKTIGVMYTRVALSARLRSRLPVRETTTNSKPIRPAAAGPSTK